MKAMIYILLLLSSIYPPTSTAAEFCVGTVAELRNALDVAESNNADDDIRIALGVYESGGSTFQYNESNGFNLKVSGGWIEVNNNCTIQSTNDPMATIIDGSNSTIGLYIRLSQNASLEVSRLTFRNGNTMQRGGGLYVSKQDNLNTGEVVVSENVFINNQANFSGALSLSGAATFHVRNNLIKGNNALVRNAVSVVSNDAVGIYFNNNTVIDNTSDTSDESGGVYLSSSGTSKLLIANNIVNGNQIEDIDARSSSDYFLYNNNIDQLVGTVPDFFNNNINLPNRFAGFFSHVPAANSPLVDAGRSPCGFICPFPTPFENNWSLGATDLSELPRIQGDKVDIGAFESVYTSDLIFWNTFD